MISPHQACYFAHDLTRLGAVGELDRLSTTLFDSKVDLNPHQVDAALFAISNPLRKGVILADEVGLGKTIEAGLILCQRWAERRRRLAVVCPAHIRKQWQTELSEKFCLPSIVLDRKVWNQLLREGVANPFDCERIVVISYAFAARMKDELRAVPFDLVVLDEAHKLRNAYQPSRPSGQAVRWAFELRQKVLLTATPLQNSLLELYGLGWVIDEHLFGDRGAFQSRYCNAGGDLAGLRTRLAQFCTRTLRKDCPYINYRKRQAMTHPFPQTDEEKELHRDVLAFMSREASFAFPQRQRHLIELILFKTLASSPQALANTLGTLRRRLVAIRDHAVDGANASESDVDAAALMDALSEDQELDVDLLLEPSDDAEDAPGSATPLLRGAAIAVELAELDALIARAQGIRGDSKSKALLTALDAAFSRLAELGARRKALIFTESRKTQEFLAGFLEANGYAGKVVSFNGSNTHPSASRAYERFVRRHEGTDKLTGSKPVDVRSALIEEFRDHAEILLATEAAAEGVNLQFCSLVVNYDLPWNPQRVEQRIGRCHRYGQEHDVVVVNFLSEGNLADRRVHDLLQQKFSLFDGLFGASDEVLGVIEDGVDFEKRIVAILKACRTDAEIEAAFDVLQRELEESISQRMTKARQQLFEHFDVDVHERLKVRDRDARQALDRVGERFWKLAVWGLDGAAAFDDANLGFELATPPSSEIPAGRYRLISAARSEEEYAATEAHLLRLSSPLGQWLLDRAKAQEPAPSTIRFDVSGHDRKVSMLTPLVGRCGWMRLDKLTLESDEREEFLLFSAVADDGENVDQEQMQRLMDVAGRCAGDAVMDGTVGARLEADAQRLREATTSKALEATNGRFRQAESQVNQWVEDRIAAADADLERLKREILGARRQTELAETIQARDSAQARLAELERKRKRLRKEYFELEDEVERKRDELIAALRRQVAQRSESTLLFASRWEVV